MTEWLVERLQFIGSPTAITFVLATLPETIFVFPRAVRRSIWESTWVSRTRYSVTTAPVTQCPRAVPAISVHSR